MQIRNKISKLRRVHGHAAPKRKAKIPRSGSVYIMAMGTSLIVACLAIAGLQSVRVQRRTNDALLQTASAKRLAQSGIEFVQQTLLEDANWRTTFSHGVPFIRTTSEGTFSVILTDPSDGNLANRTTDPVQVSSIGISGSSTQKLSTYLEPQNHLFAACRSSLYAVSTLTLARCSINANQWAYCEDQIHEMGTSNINMNCLAAQNITGNDYRQRQINGGTWPMTKPELAPTAAAYVGRHYINNAVRINAADLPTGGLELVNNGEFETNTANWTTQDCTLTRDTSQMKNGVASCWVSERSNISTPIQNITAQMIKNRTYRVSFWVRTTENQKIYPAIVSYESGSLLPTTRTGTSVAAKSGEWTLVSSNIEASWSGTLTRSEFQIVTERQSSYHFDSVSIQDAEREVGTRYIENVRLGFSNNPYGSGAVSANGIYVISTPGEKLIIRNSRINGTIVIQDSNGLELQDAISWEPSGRNFPALISEVGIKDLTSVPILSESSIGVNLNPTNTPYLGTTNSNASDSYPTVVSGAMICFRDILLDGVATHSGPIMSNQVIRVDSPNLSIQFPSDMILNPPPGFFEDPPKMLINTSSYQSIL